MAKPFATKAAGHARLARRVATPCPLIPRASQAPARRANPSLAFCPVMLTPAAASPAPALPAATGRPFKTITCSPSCHWPPLSSAVMSEQHVTASHSMLWSHLGRARGRGSAGPLNGSFSFFLSFFLSFAPGRAGRGGGGARGARASQDRRRRARVERTVMAARCIPPNQGLSALGANSRTCGCTRQWLFNAFPSACGIASEWYW